MNYCGYSKFDAANGPGVRVSIFVSGCTLHCKGCFNPESWDFAAGRPFDDAALEKLLKDSDDASIAGLSILGGDPFEKENIPGVERIVDAYREKFGNRKTIWVWTGRKLEHLEHDQEASRLIEKIDVLVDGPFIESKKVTEQGKWFGSSNQRVIELHRPCASPEAV